MDPRDEILKGAIRYAEEKSEEYINEKCDEQVSFDEIKKNAKNESTDDIDYYNNLRNNVIEKVAENTGENIEDVKEDFIKRYY